MSVPSTTTNCPRYAVLDVVPVPATAATEALLCDISSCSLVVANAFWMTAGHDYAAETLSTTVRSFEVCRVRSQRRIVLEPESEVYDLPWSQGPWQGSGRGRGVFDVLARWRRSDVVPQLFPKYSGLGDPD